MQIEGLKIQLIQTAKVLYCNAHRPYIKINIKQRKTNGRIMTPGQII